MITLDRDIPRTWMGLLTARRVLTTLAMAASLSSPSSWIGALRMSSLNWGVELASPPWELHGYQYTAVVINMGGRRKLTSQPRALLP